jgi:GH24 family phage-related lysozyme (muramidase)
MLRTKRKNGDVQLLAEMIRKEIHYSPSSYWDDSTGFQGRYLWGYGTRAPGPGMSIAPEHANADLIASVRTAIDEFKDVFEFCPSEINDVRCFALVRLMHYLGLIRFMRLTPFVASIFKGDWAEAAYQLRNTVWFEMNGRRARCIVNELRDGKRCMEPPEE